MDDPGKPNRPSGGQKLAQNLLKIGFFAVFSTLHSKVISEMPRNEVRFCQWLGMLVWAILDKPGKPIRPTGGPEMEPKLINNWLFAVFFHSALKGKFCNAQECSQILSVTRPVSLGNFG